MAQSRLAASRNSRPRLAHELDPSDQGARSPGEMLRTLGQQGARLAAGLRQRCANASALTFLTTRAGGGTWLAQWSRSSALKGF